MTDASDEQADERQPADAESAESLRESVEEKYDFEDFGPRDMAEMSYEEWDAAFDPDTWITGETLLDRVEADIKSRVADRDVFAVVERIEQDGEQRLVAYSDEGYAVVYPDGGVEGSGTVLRDVKPSVALASMEDYEVPEPPEGDVLPEPAEVPEGSGQLGNQLMQIIAGAHVVGGIVLLSSIVIFDLSWDNYVPALIAGLGFLVFGGFVFLLVANARLSDRFRAEEYRNRLRAVGMEEGERPDIFDEDGTLVDSLPHERPPEGEDDSDSESGDASGATGRESREASGTETREASAGRGTE
ncbi:DUF7319 domain-containing protein [Halorussus halophilus]|uniref:DUF7319 domain-containing protein n=1 Tax=Halorussus halophilus TaxID=2650975 RepID=UPI001CE45794|nr:hypothetical protein [Halorussus halophilus]